MTLKIKYKIQNGSNDLTLQNFGDWIDLKAAETVNFAKANIIQNISLGIAMQLPKGYEAHLLPRSSTPIKFNIMLAHNEGIIDNEYCGNEDIWKFSAKSLKATTINEGDRICQFRITLSQRASVLQKLKWLFTSKIVFEKVDNLSSNNRGGFGSTGHQ
jgi:dUTP pyrophosphatase